MYSLYQAWLLRENSSLSSTTMATMPDTIINVGTGDSLHKYTGHKIILSSQSGYLRSLLATQEMTPEIYITNVNAEIFGILLTFMYTGYLNINTENIYSVLLATHLLHMPRALDLCRSFLIEQQSIPTLLPPAPLAPTLQTTNIIKPIPSHKLLPTIIQQQTNQTSIEKSYWGLNSSVFHPVSTKLTEKKEPPPITVSIQQPSTSKDTYIATTASMSSLSPCLSSISGTSDELTVTLTEQSDESAKKKPKTSDKNSKNNEENKVIIDIASCDGPVKFQRILNSNYRAKIKEPITVVEDENNIGQNFNNVESLVIQRPLHQLNFSQGKKDDAQSEEILKCHYCDHTFKSKYCFQKHIKRHLNSVEVRSNAKLKLLTQSPMIKLNTKNLQQPIQPVGSKREVRLLDMNVQYYPCKTCGSKFPSYYFVHKHRKMCHPEEESLLNNQQLPESASKAEENTSETDS